MLNALAVRVYNVSEWTLRYLGEKKNSTGRRAVIQRKDKERKNRKGEGVGGSLLAVVLAQYVATITEPDERCRW